MNMVDDIEGCWDVIGKNGRVHFNLAFKNQRTISVCLVYQYICSVWFTSISVVSGLPVYLYCLVSGSISPVEAAPAPG